MSFPKSEIKEDDLKPLIGYPLPLQRAAYSDRTAWLMAVMSHLAYMEFDWASEDSLIQLAEEIAQISGKRGKELDHVLDVARSVTKKVTEQERYRAEDLAEVLNGSGYALVSTFDQDDTQAFLTFQPPKGEQKGMAILSFRGTTSKRDWLMNVQTELKAATQASSRDPRDSVAALHSGFVRAFEFVEKDIRRALRTRYRLKSEEPFEEHDDYEIVEQGEFQLCIPKCDDEIDHSKNGDAPWGDVERRIDHLPVYICGHSLGGALAVVATWKLESRYNAACYTFGAPRVGNSEFAEKFKTPIYRVVHGADPVPFIPPSNRLLGSVHFLLNLLPLRTEWLTRFLEKRKGYRHYGDLRYIRGDRAEIVPNVGVLDRLFRSFGFFARPKTLVDFHMMDHYRRKLRAIAIRKNQGRSDLVQSPPERLPTSPDAPEPPADGT